MGYINQYQPVSISINQYQPLANGRFIMVYPTLTNPGMVFSLNAMGATDSPCHQASAWLQSLDLLHQMRLHDIKTDIISCNTVAGPVWTAAGWGPVGGGEIG